MTSAEENVLRAAINPWPLYLTRLAKQAGRAQSTTRKHLRTLERRGMVDVYTIHDEHTDHLRLGWMATEAGHGAIQGIDAMRVRR